MSNLSLLRSSLALAASVLSMSLAGCDDDTTNPSTSDVVLANHSATPVLLKFKDVSGIEAFSLIGSDDVLSQSPNFIFGGSADGSGLMKNADGTFTMLVNHEDNFSVSRITFDKTFKPVKGEYIVNSDGGRWRLCSATLTTLEEHGFGPTYLTCGESGEESMTHAINPMGGAGQSNTLSGFGKWNAENAVPLPKTAYAGKTVILIGDDDSGPHGGQLAMYLANTVGDLSGGSVYVLARTDENPREMDIMSGQTYNVEFRKVDNHATLTGAQMNERSTALKSIAFGRVEDIDYRKGGGANSREIYFNVTGQATTGPNADYSRTKYGRTYRLKMNDNDPLKGTLEVILNGDDRTGPARTFQNVDNICVTNNFVYTQEDPNGYGDETHDSYIYQYDIATKAVKIVTELDHRRSDPKYGPSDSKFGSWEYGALIDISNEVGIPNTFALCIQPHTWTGDKYKNPDGGSVRPNENQASQIVILKGLPR